MATALVRDEQDVVDSRSSAGTDGANPQPAGVAEPSRLQEAQRPLDPHIPQRPPSLAASDGLRTYLLPQASRCRERACRAYTKPIIWACLFRLGTAPQVWLRGPKWCLFISPRFGATILAAGTSMIYRVEDKRTPTATLSTLSRPCPRRSPGCLGGPADPLTSRRRPPPAARRRIASATHDGDARRRSSSRRARRPPPLERWCPSNLLAAPCCSPARRLRRPTRRPHRTPYQSSPARRRRRHRRPRAAPPLRPPARPAPSTPFCP